MGNICNIFSNEKFEKKHQKNLNISTPQFIPQGIPVQNNYCDLSNSQPITIPSANAFSSNSQPITIPSANANAFSSNYLDDRPIYVNSFSDYSSSNYSLPNSYQRPQPNIIHHYNYNNNNDNTNTNTNNLLMAGVILSELEFVDYM